MEKETPKPRWTSLEGLGYVARDQDGSIQNESCQVNVLEYAKSLMVPPDHDKAKPYGIPIDATLAINLISDFHQLLNGEIKRKFLEGGSFAFGFLESEEETKNFIESTSTLVEILRRSSAITIDKNILLKTLSQPGCEGLRFYLCKKSVKGEDFISLVTVGVDKHGKDHLYDHSSDNTEVKGAPIENRSLVSEYGFPPGGGGSGKSELSLREIYGSPYPLLNHALDITEAKNK